MIRVMRDERDHEKETVPDECIVLSNSAEIDLEHLALLEYGTLDNRHNRNHPHW